MSVRRIYVEKKPPYNIEATHLLSEIQNLLGIKSVTALRLLNLYDVEGIDAELFDQCKAVVFSEPQLDVTYSSLPKADITFAAEYLPGQFDQRADSCAECIQLISQGERPLVRTSRVYLLAGKPSELELEKIKGYIINPVEARLAQLDELETLAEPEISPEDVKTVSGFISFDREQLQVFLNDLGLAMDFNDALLCQAYYKEENRDPTITEIRVLDTYWSDHCRHTTFGTIIEDVQIDNKKIASAFERYNMLRKELGRDNKAITLMDIATIGAKALKSMGELNDLDESEEINACSVKIKADNNGAQEDWLLMFKNETHNHPTEIEPFGGAATCVGGAIRDPLSGRSYVFGAMRVTGAGDPTVPVSDTIRGKLPQCKLVTTAAHGFSSYGNQIGLANSLVDEIYHPGYVAKRMEIGAVIGAAPLQNVRREKPVAGDVIVLLGGRTGRDGIGGATGSSKSHGVESLTSCGAEVQKGNAPIERKLQRLFRSPATTRLIKRCNDFGAGGVSVAIGELADGLVIDLDAIPKKYSGLDGTELAISESQERMAVVLSPSDLDIFLEKARAENLEATVVAKVTEAERLVMKWRGKTVVDISREFLNTNGAERVSSVYVPDAATIQGKCTYLEHKNLKNRLEALLADLNVCGKKGLQERFDGTIGAGTVLMPFGGVYQATPSNCLAMKLPVDFETTTCVGMAYGYNPYLAEQSPYDGAYQAVLESVCKLVAAGFSRKKAWLSLQEYFERLRDEPARWGKPFAALLGALDAQLDLKIAAIGGKDSMSGSFEELDVPPTLVSFAVGVGNVDNVISPEFKRTSSRVVLLSAKSQDAESILAVLDEVEALISQKKALSVWSVGYGGIAEGLCKMSFGNRIGFKLDDDFPLDKLFGWHYNSFIVELSCDASAGTPLGTTTENYSFSANGEEIELADLYKSYTGKLEAIFPTNTDAATDSQIACADYNENKIATPRFAVACPRALIPVFPGTNCEYDTARALTRAGAKPQILVVNNLSPTAITESIIQMEKAISESQMIVLPGGFSGGDEPDGSAKSIVSFFRTPRITQAVHELLNKRDGLILGICNGFQALIKLGLVPFGEIRDIDESCPTLTFNTIGRHQSMLVQTRVSSAKSPWLSLCNVGDIHTIAVSHGEGRFVADNETLAKLLENGQIAAQYVNLDGKPTMEIPFNPNGSAWAIEAISSLDGRVLGKMGHTERSGNGLYKNVSGDKFQKLFEGGVHYFK